MEKSIALINKSLEKINIFSGNISGTISSSWDK